MIVIHKKMSLENLENDWDSFMYGGKDYSLSSNRNDNTSVINIPKATPITISTKTMISYFNQPFDINTLFWKLPIIPYHKQSEGILKKQIKLTSFSKEELEYIKQKVNDEHMITTHVISSVKDSSFKHVQKINIGLSKKDVQTNSFKEKGAFYNCIALILRIKENGRYKEIHMKLFNTGKTETPGIQDDNTLYYTLHLLQSILHPLIKEPLYFNKNDIHTVLINSNFNCGYFVHREKMYNILRKKYNIISLYDPCSYPGIQCKFYYNSKHMNQNGVCMCNTRCNKKGKGTGEGECIEISFMIFRTGSVLIVGNCNIEILNKIYEYLKTIFENEYYEIQNGIVEKKVKPIAQKKIKKKIIYM